MSGSSENKLRRWRREGGITVMNAAASIGVTRQTWHSWERGASIPPPALMQRIVAMTSGAVTANDFYDLPGTPAEAAE